jgi:murein DD-endopeptidase MepM/ murein hydrolase activator NlpD
MMDASARLAAFVKTHPVAIGKVVDYNPGTDSLFKLDLTAANTELTPALIADTAEFSNWVTNKLKANNCRYGVGGYLEHRTIYDGSALFNTTDEPRRLHLGVDIWADAGTPIYAPLAGTIHSFQDNNNPADYGPTIILQHDLDGLTLYTLYGHLNRECLQGLQVGQAISKNQHIAAFGDINENGHWPPHLHFQLMFDMQGKAGDYPGACRYSEKDEYIKNIPDPNLILGFPIL